MPEFVPVRNLLEPAEQEVASWANKVDPKVVAGKQLNVAAATAAEFSLEMKVRLCVPVYSRIW